MTAARFDLVVRDGLVGPGALPADVGVRDGRIAAIADRLEDAERVIEAAGRLVLPGGVDGHCHMDQPDYGGAACADDFRTGTVSAACGGTTTVIPFAMTDREARLVDTVAAYRRKAEGKAYIDYGIHPTVQHVTDDLLAEDLPRLVADGFGSLKIFTTYTGFALGDAEILAVLDTAARHGALVMVHAETDALVAYATRELIVAGHHAPRFHAQARPVAAERDAVSRVAAFAEAAGAKVLIVHVSSREGLAEIGRAKARGVRVYAETCPQYLFLSENDLAREGLEGARFMACPPLRSRADGEALLAALGNGLVTVYGSDHSPTRLQGANGRLRNGADSRFDQISNGVPGLELRMPLLFSEGYLTGRLSLAQFVAVTATGPAELHGAAPQKGSLVVGADADLVIWDSERETTITRAMLHDATDDTPYEGWCIKGWPVTTVSRGEVVVDDGRVLAEPGRGRFVPCRF